MFGLKKFFLRRRNKDIFKEPSKKAKGEIPNYQNAESIGVLIDSADIKHVDSLQKFVKKLEKDGKKVSILTYLTKKKFSFNFKFKFFKPKDVTLTGYINSVAVTEFVNKSFDYLYCIEVKPTLVLDNIMLRSKAKCKISKFHSYRKPYLEMMIDVKEEDEDKVLIEHMLHYTETALN